MNCDVFISFLNVQFHTQSAVLKNLCSSSEEAMQFEILLFSDPRV